MKAVNSGQIEGGVIYHYYYLRDQAKTGENSGNAALYYFKGQDPGAFVSISGGGVLASSKHQADAQAFLKWVTGHAGQAVLKDGDAYEYVVGDGEASNPKLTPLTDLDAPKIDVSKLNSKKVVEPDDPGQGSSDPVPHSGGWHTLEPARCAPVAALHVRKPRLVGRAGGSRFPGSAPPPCLSR